MNNVKTSDITLVVQKFSPYINGLCRKLFIVGGTSEDLYEEGIIGLLEACNSYNGESLFEARFEAFAKMCVKRQIIDAIRVANAQKNRALNESVSLLFSDNDGDEQSLLDIFADRNTSNDPLEMFIDKEKITEWKNICEKSLSDFEKLVLKHYLDGEKQSEIAKSLNRDVKSIDNTIQRIKTKICKKYSLHKKI